MANPSYCQVLSLAPEMMKHTDMILHLYMRQHPSNEAPNGNQKLAGWSVHDGPGPDANLVARANLTEPNGLACFSMEFVDGRFKGSSIKVLGDFESEEGEWAIAGGTGFFACAQGVIAFKKTHSAQGDDATELRVRALCLTLEGSPAPVQQQQQQQSSVSKIGPWGGERGSPFDSEAPQRLESVTIHSGHVIDSIAFSYVGQDGKKRTVGPCGGEGGPEVDTIQLGPWETLQQVRGTHNIDPFEGHTKLITSLTFVTNLRTYGPFGMAEDKHFSVPVHTGSTIVGFFGSAERYLVSLGVYVRPTSVPAN